LLSRVRIIKIFKVNGHVENQDHQDSGLIPVGPYGQRKGRYGTNTSRCAGRYQFRAAARACNGLILTKHVETLLMKKNLQPHRLIFTSDRNPSIERPDTPHL
jgi:hypothetical protein